MKQSQTGRKIQKLRDGLDPDINKKFLGKVARGIRKRAKR